ncbi:zinc knuckle-domain-containing protein [Poronia punctata]|nr:zinc knuckle-domain-containing protein [Poronia punctata]
MYRRGPQKSTPANVQCQKCLKRGHYSYECKASAQERPYIPRPSRTQQLFNPKLVPKLTSETPDAQENKKGLADEQLAKREAERAKKQALEQDEDSDNDVPGGGRSPSYDSASTISSSASRGPSPAPRRRGSVSSPRPSRSFRSPSPMRRPSRRRSLDSQSDHDRRYSSSPERRSRDVSPGRPPSRRTRSPSRRSILSGDRFHSEEQTTSHQYRDRQHRGRYLQSPSKSPQPDNRRRFRSRSPQDGQRYGSGSSRHNPQLEVSPRRGERGGRGGRDQRERPPKQDTRERSLSPFSKRLALTQAMNGGR